MMCFSLVLLICVLMLNQCDCKCCFRMKQNKTRSCYNATDVTSDFHDSEEARFQKADESLRIPGRPKKLRVKGRTLVWESTEWKLRNYLLKIERDQMQNEIPIRKTIYFLLGPFKVQKRSVFYFNCSGITRHVEKVKFTLWALPRMDDHATRIYKTTGENFESITWKRKDPKKELARKTWIDCVCRTKIIRVRLAPINDSALNSITMVKNDHIPVTVKFYLNRNGETVDEWQEDTGPNENITQLVRTLPLKPGVYELKAQRQCPKQEPTWSTLNCQQVQMYFLRSETCTLIDKTVTAPVTNISKDTNVLAVRMSQHLRNILPVSLVSVAMGVGGFAVIVVLILLTKLRKKKTVFGTPAVTTSLVYGRPDVNESLAVIYVNDSEVHRSRVYDLCTRLKAHGIDASPIDEYTRNKEMIANWIAEGEKLSQTYRNFLFVLSHSLVDVCRTPDHDRPITGSIFNDTASPVGHSKLPLVILNSIKPRVLQFDTRDIQTVYFDDNSKASAKTANNLCKEFTACHGSIVHSETFRLDVKNKTIIENEELAKFMISYKGNATMSCVVELDTSIKGSTIL